MGGKHYEVHTVRVVKEIGTVIFYGQGRRVAHIERERWIDLAGCTREPAAADLLEGIVETDWPMDMIGLEEFYQLCLAQKLLPRKTRAVAAFFRPEAGLAGRMAGLSWGQRQEMLRLLSPLQVTLVLLYEYTPPMRPPVLQAYRLTPAGEKNR